MSSALALGVAALLGSVLFAGCTVDPFPSMDKAAAVPAVVYLSSEDMPTGWTMYHPEPQRVTANETQSSGLVARELATVVGPGGKEFQALHLTYRGVGDVMRFDAVRQCQDSSWVHFTTGGTHVLAAQVWVQDDAALGAGLTAMQRAAQRLGFTFAC